MTGEVGKTNAEATLTKPEAFGPAMHPRSISSIVAFVFIVIVLVGTAPAMDVVAAIVPIFMTTFLWDFGLFSVIKFRFSFFGIV